jgi:hypothetical protein
MLGAIALLGILSVPSFLVLSRRESKTELGPDHALGALAAKETTTLMDDRRQIVVVALDIRQFEMPALAAQDKGVPCKGTENTAEVSKGRSDRPFSGFPPIGGSGPWTHGDRRFRRW